jgi:hypothetical protein
VRATEAAQPALEPTAEKRGSADKRDRHTHGTRSARRNGVVWMILRAVKSTLAVGLFALRSRMLCARRALLSKQHDSLHGNFSEVAA